MDSHKFNLANEKTDKEKMERAIAENPDVNNVVRAGELKQVCLSPLLPFPSCIHAQSI